MKNTSTKSANKMLLRIAIAFVMLFSLFITTETAKSDINPYCNPYNRYLYNGYIRGVHFYNTDGTKDWANSSGYSFYSYVVDYTNADFKDILWSNGDVVNLTIYVYAGSYSSVNIWVDWNNDGDFSDRGELVFQPRHSYRSGNYSYSGKFTIPPTAAPGKHRMRVNGGYYFYVEYYNRTSNGCRALNYNEYEDYTLVLAPKNDAGITSINAPAANFNSDDPQDVEVTIKNFSKLELHEADIYWSVNGVQQGMYHWTGSLAKDATDRVTIATGQTFTPQDPWDPFVFESWTDGGSLIGEDAAANASNDGNPNNDRVKANITCVLNDAGFVSADPMLPLDYGENDVVLRIKNYAPKPLSRVTINYSIDGIAQMPYTATFNPPLNKGETADVLCGTYFFGAGNRAYVIEGETSNPNGVEDQVPANDAGRSEVYKALQGGTYTVGPRESDYENLEDVMRFINYWGLAGPVTFLIREGSYYSSFVLKPKSGRQFPMTFESITRRPLDVTIYNDGSENDFVFQFDGYDNIIFKNLSFEAPGVFFDFLNGNNNISFDKCVFNAAGGPKMLGMTTGGDIFFIEGAVSGLNISNSTFNNGLSSIHAPDLENLNSLSNWDIHDNEFNSPSYGFIDLAHNPASYLSFMNNVFNGNRNPFGILAFAAMNMMVTNNRFNGISSHRGGLGAAILMGDISLGARKTSSVYTGINEIKGNTITVANAHGIEIASGNNFLVEDNIISGSASNYTVDQKYAGILDVSSVGSVIHRNTVSVNDMDGIYSFKSNGTNISYNKVTASAMTKDIVGGIRIESVSRATVADNAVAVSGTVAGIVNNFVANIEYIYNSVSVNGRAPAFFVDQTPPADEGEGEGEGEGDYGDGGTGPLFRSGKTQNDVQLIADAGEIVLHRNIFQQNANGLAGVIIDEGNPIVSDYNNWWTADLNTMRYNGTLMTFAAYQAASTLDEHSSNVQAMFMSPTDLRLTEVNADLYYTRQMFGGTKFNNFEENDLSGTARTRTFYKGAYSMYPTIEIAQEPKDIVDCFGTTEHAFVVIANVDYNAELTYQWYKDGEAIFEETGPILYINDPLDYEMGAIYRCKVMGTGEADDMWTRPAMLYTLRPTEITRQPNNIRIDLGDVATFEIDMHIYKEAPSMYQPDIQWYRGTVALQENDRIAGVNSSMMTIRDVQPDDLGDDYYVIISGQCGSDQSDNITLSEIPALTVEDLPATTDVCKGSDASFTANATSSVAGVTITYQWYKDGTALENNAKYAGVTAATMILTKAENDDAGDYQCEVILESFDKKTTNATKLVVKNVPTIKTDLQKDLSVKTGEKLTLTVEAEGDALTYQWYKDGKVITGATEATYEKDKVSTTDEGTYKVKVTNNCGDIESGECVVSVTTFVIMGVDGEAGELILNQNVPNPFSTISRIAFVMPEAGQAKLAITNANGKELAVIVDGSVSAGLNQYNIDANALNLSSGVYYYTLTVKGNSVTKTMVIVK